MMALVSSVRASSAQAQAGHAKVYLLTQKPPPGMSAARLQAYAKQQHSSVLQENDVQPLDSRSWRAQLVTVFDRPLGDSEFSLLFYEARPGVRTLVQDMVIMVANPKDKVLVQTLNLPRKMFQPNRDMEMIVKVRQREVGSCKFSLRGELPKNSGTVDFTK